MKSIRSFKELRENAGFTQERLAQAIGVSVASVSNWETGACRPRATSIAALAEALGTNVVFLGWGHHRRKRR